MSIDEASRLLRRKIPQTGHLMLPRRLWMQTVPTQGCELVIAFGSCADDEAVEWLAGRLKTRLPELIVTVTTTSSSSRAIYLASSIDGLVKGAEDLRLYKKTKPEYGCGLREVTSSELSIFQGVEDLSTFFTSQERHTIMSYLLDSLRATEDDVCSIVPLRPGEAIVSKWKSAGLIAQVFPLHDHKKLAHLQNSWVPNFFRYQPLDSIHDYFGDKIGIYFAWLGFYTASLTFPAFLGTILWLSCWGKDQATEDKAFVAIALLNVVWGSVWLEAWKRRTAELQHRWGLPADFHELLLEPRPHFKGELQPSSVTGRVEPCYPTWRRNLFRYCVTLPLMLVCLCTVFVTMLLILKLQDYWDKWLEAREWPGLLSWGPKMLMAMAISFFDVVCTKLAVWLNENENYRTDEAYHNYLIVKLTLFRFVNSFLALFYIAFYLQDMERLKEQLLALLLMRQIVGNIKESCVPYFLEQMRLAKLSFDLFGALSPTQDTPKDWPEGEAGGDEGGSNMGEAGVCQEQDNEPTPGDECTDAQIRRRNVAATSCNSDGADSDKQPTDDGKTATATAAAAATATVAATATAPATAAELPRSFSRTRIVSQADVESNMQQYEGTFEDYLEMLIQFGYVMLFSSAFPLAGMCAFLNNLIEIRSDAFKLCCVHQRPFPQRVGSIGVWQDAMEFLGLLGIVVNCMLIGQSGQVHRMFPEMTKIQTVLLIIVLEHAMIALKYTISYAIADVPEWVSEEQAKAEFRRREALRRISTSNSPPTRESSQPPSPRLSSQRSSVDYPELPNTTNTDATKNRNSSESKVDTSVVRRTQRPDAQLLKKFSIPEFSALKKSSNQEPYIGRKLASQEFASLKKLPTTHELPIVNKSTTPEFPTPNKLHTPENSVEKKSSFDLIEEIPSFGSLSKTSRRNSDDDHDKPPIPSMPRSASRFSTATPDKTTPTAVEQVAPHVTDNTPVTSAPSDVDQKKRHFNFMPDEHMTISEEITEKIPRAKRHSGSSSSHSINSVADSPAQSQNILHSHILSQERPSQDSITSLQRSLSPRRTYSSIESLPQDISSSPPSDGIVEPPISKAETLRRKPPNKFLKRAQSFSQFLKKKPTLPERRKKSGESSRDDYYLPTNNEEVLEEPQGEMMLVPIEMLVSLADLDANE